MGGCPSPYAIRRFIAWSFHRFQFLVRFRLAGGFGGPIKATPDPLAGGKGARELTIAAVQMHAPSGVQCTDA